MTAETFLLTLVGVLVVVYAFVALAAYLRVRGPRLVLLEADSATADPRHAAVADGVQSPDNPTSTQGDAERLRMGPANPGAIERLRGWFAGKSCAICEKPVPPIHRVERHHPGLITQDQNVIGWDHIVRDEQLMASLESHLPVCSNCLMAETFRREFPELVLDRPEHGRG